MTALSRTQALLDEMTDWRQDFHRHPELAFAETRTAGLAAERLHSFGVDEIHPGLAKTGLVGVIRGALGDGPGIGLRADMDALPMQESNAFPHASQTPGIMHACGHDGHVAMLLGAAKVLAETRSFRGTVYLIFQPAEENVGGGRVMVEEGLFDRFPMDEIYGMHNWPGGQEGSFALRPGPIMASYDIFEMTVEGRGGHAGMPNLVRDSLLAASHLVVALQSVVSRSVDPLQAAVLSVTQIHGGDTWNVMPQTTIIRGTVRTLDQGTQADIKRRIAEISQAIGRMFDVDVAVRYEYGYPTTVNAAGPTEKAIRAATSVVGAAAVHTSMPPSMGSEDFAFMLEKKPGAYIWLSSGEGRAGLHSPFYDFNDSILAVGAAYWVALAESVLRKE